jgi:hypothetical protein
VTYEEMFAEAQEAVQGIANTVYFRQRLFMPKSELVTLLMNAYGKGVTKQAERAVKAFAPEHLSEYRKLVAQ